MGIKHAYKSLKTDPVDTTLVGATKWNDDHYFLDTAGAAIGALGDLPYRGTAGLVTLLAGAAGVLTSAGSGNVPAWSMTPAVTSLTLAATTTSTDGVLFRGSDRFLHDYFDPTSLGVNLFLGKLAGNFTMGPAGGANSLGSYNTGIGFSSLNALTTGFNNTALGENTMKVTTTGASNTALGAGVMIANTTGQDNVAVGTAALYGNTTGQDNVAVGAYAGYVNGTNANVTGRFNTWVGWKAGPAAATQREGTIGIGYEAQPTADYQAMLGGALITTTILRGAVSGPTSVAVGTTPAVTGAIRLTNNTEINWRNAANTTDYGWTLNASDQLTSSANVLVSGNLFAISSLRVGAAQYIYWDGRTTLNSPSNGQLALTNAAVSSGVAFDLNTDGLVKILTRALADTAGLHASFFQGLEVTAPAAPAANGWRLYAEDNGSGKTRLMVRFATGASQQIAIEP